MNKELLNVEFTDGIRKYKVIGYFEKFNMYQLMNYTENKNTELMKAEQIENYLQNQEILNVKYERGLKRAEEIENQLQKEQQEEEQRQKDYNFCYGFTDNKTALQKGKILKILNSNILYKGEFYSSKNLIHMLINKDSYTKEYFNNNRYSKKKIEGEHKKLNDKLEYRFYFSPNNIFLDINKTEYDYINYLIDNNITV